MRYNTPEMHAYNLSAQNLTNPTLMEKHWKVKEQESLHHQRRKFESLPCRALFGKILLGAPVRNFNKILKPNLEKLHEFRTFQRHRKGFLRFIQTNNWDEKSNMRLKKTRN